MYPIDQWEISTKIFVILLVEWLWKKTTTVKYLSGKMYSVYTQLGACTQGKNIVRANFFFSLFTNLDNFKPFLTGNKSFIWFSSRISGCFTDIQHYYSTNCNNIQIWSWCSRYLSSVGDRYPAIYVASYVGRKSEVKNVDRKV